MGRRIRRSPLRTKRNRFSSFRRPRIQSIRLVPSAAVFRRNPSSQPGLLEYDLACFLGGSGASVRWDEAVPRDGDFLLCDDGELEYFKIARELGLGGHQARGQYNERPGRL